MVKEKIFFFFCLCFCHLVGVFADELKSVSVMEGDSVTLKINATGIQRGEKILWTFGTNGPLIAKTSGVNNTILDVSDVRFRDRLKLDKTGSLTIMNIRTEDTGVYVVEISRSSSSTTYRFTVTVYVFADAVKTVSAKEGDSVTIESGLTQIQERDLIRWWFEPLNTKIAEIDKEKGIFKTSDVPDGRFRDRLKLDHQTGSLTITNTRTTHSGEYNVTIDRSTGGVTTIRFNVTVYGHAPCCDSVEAVLRLVATALMGVASAAAAFLLVNDVRASRRKTEKIEEIS